MSESIDKNDDLEYDKDLKDKTDFVEISGNIIYSINYKVAFFLFVIGMILFSDVFINNILSELNGSVEDECPTTQGTTIQLFLLCICYIIIDLLVQKKIL